MSGKVKIKVRVARPKFDEFGNEIPHVHRHSSSTKVYKHKNGRIRREESQEPSTDAQTLHPATTNDVTSLTVTEDRKDRYIRYKKDHSRQNKIHYAVKPESSSSDDEIDDLKPEKISRYSRFLAKQPWDTLTSSNTYEHVGRSTIESHTTTIETSDDDVEGPPRTSQSFTSFMGSTAARTHTNTIDTDPSVIPVHKGSILEDPFNIVNQEDSQPLYPASRRIPTHTLCSDELRDPFDELFISKIGNVHLNDEQKSVLSDRLSAPDHAAEVKSKKSSINIPTFRSVKRANAPSVSTTSSISMTTITNDPSSISLSGGFSQRSLRSRNAAWDSTSADGSSKISNKLPKYRPVEEEVIEEVYKSISTDTKTHSSSSYDYEEEYSSEYENATNPNQTDDLTTVSALVTASNTQEGEFVEVSHTESGAVPYVEVSDTSRSDYEKPKDSLRKPSKASQNSKMSQNSKASQNSKSSSKRQRTKQQQFVIPSSSEYETVSEHPVVPETDGMTTVSALISATTGEGEFVEVSHTDSAAVAYVEVSDTSKSSSAPRRQRARTRRPQSESTASYTADSAAAGNAQPSLTTVSELVTATAGEAEYAEALDSKEGELYVEVSTDRFGETGDGAQVSSEELHPALGDAEEDYNESDRDSEEDYEEDDYDSLKSLTDHTELDASSYM